MKLVQIGLQVCAGSHLNVWISLSPLERTNTERKGRILQQGSAFIFITRSGISPEYESDHFSGLLSILEWTGKSNRSLRWRSGDSIRSPSWCIHTVFATLWFSFRFFAILTFLFLRALTDKSISNRGENASLLGPENRFCFFPWKTSSDASLWSCNMHLLLLSITVMHHN